VENGDRLYELTVINAGPAAARDVSVDLVLWGDGPLGLSLDRVDVAPALLVGDQRSATLRLPASVDLGDRSQAVEIGADWYDDNGVRNERLALVLEGGLILTPPQPPLPRGFR
jgi:hypothetical protein